MSLPEIDLKETIKGCLWVAITDTLIALELTGLNAERFHRRKRLLNTGITDFPACIIAPAAINIDWNEGSTESERPHYGFAVAVVAAGNLDQTEQNCGIHFYWEEKIIQRFLNEINYVGLQLPAGAQLVRSNVVPPSEAFLTEAGKNGWDAQYWIIRAQVEYDREN
jgi:hypothetical protein